MGVRHSHTFGGRFKENQGWVQFQKVYGLRWGVPPPTRGGFCNPLHLPRGIRTGPGGTWDTKSLIFLFSEVFIWYFFFLQFELFLPKMCPKWPFWPVLRGQNLWSIRAGPEKQSPKLRYCLGGCRGVSPTPSPQNAFTYPPLH